MAYNTESYSGDSCAIKWSPDYKIDEAQIKEVIAGITTARATVSRACFVMERVVNSQKLQLPGQQKAVQESMMYHFKIDVKQLSQHAHEVMRINSTLQQIHTGLNGQVTMADLLEVISGRKCRFRKPSTGGCRMMII
jgi:hypothetical protein